MATTTAHAAPRRARLSPRSLVVALAALAAAAGLAVVVTSQRGGASTGVELSPGTVWLPSSATGTVSLFDGATGSRVQVVPVVPPGHRFDVVQGPTAAGSGAYVVDHTAGGVLPVDGATLEPSSDRARVVSSPGDDRLAVLANERSTWVIVQHGGLAVPVAPRDLAELGGAGQQAVPDTTHAVLADDGALWTLTDGGAVRSLEVGRTAQTFRPLAEHTGLDLVEAGGRPVLVDASASRMASLRPDGSVGRTVDYQPLSGGRAVVSGGGSLPFVLAVSPTEGTAEVVDVEHRRASSVAVGDAGVPGQTRYGAAVVKGSTAFVPDLVRGTVVALDLSGATVRVQGQIPLGLAGAFELVEHDGHVWFNQAGSDAAGLITDDLAAVRIAKQDGDGRGIVVGRLEALARNGSIEPVSTLPPVTVGPPPVPSSETPPAPAPTPASAPPPTPAPTPPPSVVPPPPVPPKPVPPQPVPPTDPPKPPAFRFAPDPVAAGQEITFTDTSPGDHAVFRWTFDGGTPASQSGGATAKVTFAAAGAHTVTLTVTSHGQSAAVQRVVEVGAGTPPTTTTTTMPRSTSSSVLSSSSSMSTTSTTKAKTWTVVSTGQFTFDAKSCGTVFELERGVNGCNGADTHKDLFQDLHKASSGKDCCWLIPQGSARLAVLGPADYGTRSPSSLPGETYTVDSSSRLDYTAINGGDVFAVATSTTDVYAKFQALDFPVDGNCSTCGVDLHLQWTTYRYG